MTSQPSLLQVVQERDLQRTLEELFLLHGYLIFHDRDSRLNQAGFPDLVACKVGAPLWLIEAKTESGKLRAAQRRWAAALAAAQTVRFAVIRPHDVPWLADALAMGEKER